MKTKIKSIIKSLAPALLVGLSILSTSISVASAIVLNTREDYYFVYTDENDHQFKCYNILSDDPDDHSVSISWLIDDVNNPYPEGNLDIPSSVSDGTTTYKVKSIAKAGFRRCPSTSITVPETVLEIKEEAFAYCQNITDFTFPSSLDEIAKSSFLDCRNLTTLAYRDEDGNRTVTNNTITKIGDHAFDSCVKLKNFYCPTSVTEFGHSCFQKCESIVNFFFPVKNADIDHYTNKITIKSYAFADCRNLNYVYFEENMFKVEHHAFADCNTELKIHYTGDSDPVYDDHWRDVYITTNKPELIPIINSENEIRSDIKYPGLYYTTETDDIKLDSAGTNSTSVIWAQSQPYAKIYNFEAPFETIDDYYDVDTGELILPDTIDGKPLKVINENTFQNHTELKIVRFNKSLVQIKHLAFYHCTNIEELDFTKCTSLKEISYDIFQEPINPWKNEVYNTVLEEIHLPACLEYIGEFAFYNFLALKGQNAITFGGDSSQLKVIGAFAFAVNSKSDDKESTISYPDEGGSIDLVLPCSLSDAAAQAANYQHIHHNLDGNTRYIYLNTKRPYAIGTHAFDNRKSIKTVTMKNCEHAEHINSDSFTTSLASNVFVRCINMYRFKSNKNLCYIGKDTFKSIKLKELFLSSEKGELATYKYPWGIEDNENKYGETLFWGKETENAVVYVTGPKAPRDNDNMLASDATTNPNYWNSNSTNQDNTYANQLKDDNDNSQRTRVPTYYNINFFSNDSIVYWKPNENGGGSIVSEPTCIEDYDNGLITFIKGTDNKYTVGRYYGLTGVDEINLTNIPNVSNNLTKIGDEAFASTSGVARGLYFVLPNTVTEIAERAFYRSSKDSGVQIITYQDGNTIKCPSSLSSTTNYGNIKNACSSSGGNTYFCMPTVLTKIGRSAFYNNRFKIIELTSSLTFIGNAAFYTHDSPRIDSFEGSFGNSSKFVTSNGGIYYSDDSAKILLYQAAGVSSTLTIDSGTVAVGMRAVTNTKYTKISLPSSLTTLYGGAFQKNNEVKEVEGVSSLVYISTMMDDNQQIYSDATYGDYFDNIDHRKVKNYTDMVRMSRNSAFKSCTKLETLNFKSMTNVKYIGPSSFNECKVLQHMTGNDTYKFYKCDHTTNNSTGGHTTIQDDPVYDSSLVTNGIRADGVLDLSACSSLVSIAGDAFKTCNKISYAIMPDSTPNAERNANGIRITKSKLQFCISGSESKKGSVFGGDARNVLIGETISQAWPNFQVGGIDNEISKHYSGDSFKNCNNYYYAQYKSDISNIAWTGVKYWTKVVENGNTKYVLFENGYQAYDYLPAYSAS